MAGNQQQKLPTALWPDLPRNVPLLDDKGMLAPIWQLFFDQLILALQTNFRTEGFVIPGQTSANIALLTAVKSYQSIIYNSSIPGFQGNINGTWKTFLS